MTGYYLVDNPNPYALQYSTYRNGRLSGGVLLHTTESPKNRGALPIANWIATQRRDYGSYHAIFDADSTVLMAPDAFTVWHCAASGYNSTTVGISWACRTSDLHPDDDWTRKAFAQAARWLVDFWTRNGIDAASAARFIPATDTRTRPGLSTHGDAQPADRSDAFTRHPQRAGLEALLLAEVAKAITPTPPTPEDDEMRYVVQDPRPGRSIWLCSGALRRRLENMDQVNAQLFFGAEMVKANDPNASDGVLAFLQSFEDVAGMKAK